MAEVARILQDTSENVCPFSWQFSRMMRNFAKKFIGNAL
jgi:hypothetical protein